MNMITDEFYITGLHGCKCHPFKSWEEEATFRNRKFSKGDPVYDRCSRKKGVVVSVNDHNYLIVSFGERESDRELYHSVQLEPIAVTVQLQMFT